MKFGQIKTLKSGTDKTKMTFMTWQSIIIRPVILLLLSFSFSGTILSQKIYHIDPDYTGNSSDGSISSPYKSLSDFKWEAGSSYLVKSSSTISTNEPIAISVGNVTFGSYGEGERPVIKGNFPIGARALAVRGDNITIQNLDIQALDTGPDDAAGCVVDMIGGKNNILDNVKTTGGTRGINASQTKGTTTIINCHVTDTWDDGMYHRTNDTVIIENTLVERVNLKYHINPDQTYAGGDCVQFDFVTHFELRNCTLDKTFTGGKFLLIADHFETGITENSRFIAAAQQHGVYLGIGDNFIFRNNHLSGGQYGIWNQLVNLEVYYNVIQNTGLAGYYGGAKTNSKIYNNLFTDCGEAILGWSENMEVNNNIFLNNKKNITGNLDIINADYNCYFPGRPAGTEPNSISVDPKIINAGNNDFKLTPASPCIDAGLNISSMKSDMMNAPVPFGSKADIGPNEYGSQSDNSNDLNSAPEIKINYEESGTAATIIVIDATASSDPDGDNLIFIWTTSSDIIFLSSANTAVVRFLAPDFKSSQPVSLELEVTDGKISTKSTVTIDIVPFKPHISIIKPMRAEASSFQDTNYPQNAIDNDLKTRWSAEGDESWLNLELEEETYLSHVKLALFQGNQKISYFDLYASNDNENWDLLLESASTSGISEYNELFELPVEATYTPYKYVRLVGHKNSEDGLNSYSELMVFGNSDESDIGDVTGIEDKTVGETFDIYPNPSDGEVVVTLSETDKSVNSVKIYSMNGQVLFQKDYGYQAENLQFGHDLPDGIYLMQVVFSDESSAGKKLIVRR